MVNPMAKMFPITHIRKRHGEVIYERMRPACVKERKWLRETGLKVGDEVILMNLDNTEQLKGFEGMDENLKKWDGMTEGGIYKVEKIGCYDDELIPFGICITENDGPHRNYWVPFWCLIPA